jgi:hypothetical protein
MEVDNYVKKNLLELNIIKDKEENNLLSVAVQSGYYEICELLIKNGLPINSKNVSSSQVLTSKAHGEHSASLCDSLQKEQDRPATHR